MGKKETNKQKTENKTKQKPENKNNLKAISCRMEQKLTGEI